jgi:hypothetical protein
MSNPEVRIQANPADHDLRIALFRDGRWWTGTTGLDLELFSEPVDWPVLQPAVTPEQARAVIAAIYDRLQPDAFADRMDSAQEDLTRVMLDEMAGAGIKVADHR